MFLYKNHFFKKIKDVTILFLINYGPRYFGLLVGLISNKLHLTDWFITLLSFELLVKIIFSVFLR